MKIFVRLEIGTVCACLSKICCILKAFIKRIKRNCGSDRELSWSLVYMFEIIFL